MQGQALSGIEVERVREAFREAMRADDFDKARTLAKLHATLRRDRRAREARQASEGVKTLRRQTHIGGDFYDPAASVARRHREGR